MDLFFQVVDKKFESTVMIKMLKHLWFLLDVCSKTMCQAIIINRSNKISRRKRFSAFTVDAIQSLFNEIVQKIIEHHKAFAVETRAANLALAYFAKYCLNLADRGLMFDVIYELIKSYDLVESGVRESIVLPH